MIEERQEADGEAMLEHALPARFGALERVQTLLLQSFNNGMVKRVTAA